MTSINSKNAARLYYEKLINIALSDVKFIGTHKKYMSSLYLVVKVMVEVRERQPNTRFWSGLSVKLSVVRTSAIGAMSRAHVTTKHAKLLCKLNKMG